MTEPTVVLISEDDRKVSNCRTGHNTYTKQGFPGMGDPQPQLRNTEEGYPGQGTIVKPKILPENVKAQMSKKTVQTVEDEFNYDGPVVPHEIDPEVAFTDATLFGIHVVKGDDIFPEFPPRDEVDKVLAHCEGELDYNNFCAGVLNGSLTLFKWDTGWAVTSPWQGWLDIVGMYETGKKVPMIMDILQQVSMSMNLKGIRTINKRRGSLRRAKDWGFRVRYIEFVRDNK